MKFIGSNPKLIEAVPSELLERGDESIALADLTEKVPKEIRLMRAIGLAPTLAPASVVLAGVRGFRHVVQASDSRFLEEVRIALSMIQDPAAFLENPEGLILGAGVRRRKSYSFTRSKEKERVISAVLQELQSIDPGALVRDSVNVIVDELFTNAVFNSPLDDSGAPLFAHRARSEDVTLPGGREAQIFLANEGDWLLVGCEDPFGSFVHERVLYRIHDCYQRGVSAAMRSQGGGAGIGCRMMFDLAAGLYVGVSPGQKTTIAYRLPLRHGARHRELLPKSFHISVLGETSMPQLRVEQTHKDSTLKIEFYGPIDEDCDFSKISLAGVQAIHLEMGGVTSINSCGIREWIRWIKGAPQGTRVSYLQCPKVMVDQINMIEGFLPEFARVESFHVPYFCPSCEQMSSVLLQAGKDFSGGKATVAPTQKCSHCGKTAEIDVIEDQYFRFLEGQG